MNTNDAFFEVEWNYRYQERLGMMVEDGLATMAQMKYAAEETDKEIERLKLEIQP